MIYNLSDPLDLQAFARKAEHLKLTQAMAELTEKRPRSMAQNAYCHLAIAYFALQVGLTAAEVKDAYFKAHCSPDIFVRTHPDPVLGGTRRFLRSTASLSREELSLAIDRFLRFAAAHGVYVATPDEYVALLHMQRDVSRHQAWL